MATETRTLTQAVDDWFRSSPAWPIPAGEINVDAETAAFMLDGTEFGEADVRAAIKAFVAAL